MTRTVTVGNIRIGGGNPLVLIAGPCVLESRDAALQVADSVKAITERLAIPYIFKASYDKANRTSITSYRGPGLAEGLEILAEVKEKVAVPVLSDVHHPQEVVVASQVLDVLQIPAFLCRQTDLVTTAAKQHKPINLKKGQFLAPFDIEAATKKITAFENYDILLTERGTSFGYNNLVVDMRSLVIMRDLGFPVIFDATHSVQLPGAQGTSSGGDRRFIPPLAKAAAAVGIDGVFLEVHDNPEKARCDGPNAFVIKELPALLEKLLRISAIARERTTQ
jgi:2-dehydro-3-deoxyphosphooctonate aldolase (KDO 8-P synthase)